MATERTPHECPICKALIYNELPTFHDHLNTSCAKTLFSYFPHLAHEPFNALWYHLADMVKDGVIISSPTPNTSATVRPEPRHGERRLAPMDLEDLDRDIGILRQKEKQRHRQEA